MADQPRVRVIPSDFLWIPPSTPDRAHPVAVSVAKDIESGAARLHIFTTDTPGRLLGTLHVPAVNVDDLCGFLRHGNEGRG
jgi:hypothetical protein